MKKAPAQSLSKPVASPSRLSDHGYWRADTVMETLIITAPARDVLRKPPRYFHVLTNDTGKAKALSQFFTRPKLAARYYRAFSRRFDPTKFQIVEPSAGSGVFLRVLPMSTFSCDIAPASPGIFEADFLTLGIHGSRPIACIGNPPFGKNSALAISFFNHAAAFSDVIAFILPRTFRKTSVINQLDDRFHLLYEKLVPDDAFTFEGKVRSVPTIFQIWVRKEERRAKLPEITKHQDFKFLPEEEAEDADFGLQRVGKNAGVVHHGLKRSHKAHYFIKGDVEDIMVELAPAFAKVAANTAGKPSLAMTEVVSIYTARVAKRRRKKIETSARRPAGSVETFRCSVASPAA